MSLTADGLYCPGCGYDLRGLSSDRCPECGLTIDATRSGIIPWERRKGIGYFRSFFSTLGTATFHPMRLARATGAPIDLRSARLFRWIVRVLVIVPCTAVFFLAIWLNGGTDMLVTVNMPGNGMAQPLWEPRFVWTVGATLLPVLPIGFAISVILATGISHWLFIKRVEMPRRNRAMVLSNYFCAPLAWMWIPCLAATSYSYFSDPQWVPFLAAGVAVVISWPVLLLSAVAALVAFVNLVRMVDAATECGKPRSLVIGVGVLVQAIASCAVGLALFPPLAGLFRLMFGSSWR